MGKSMAHLVAIAGSFSGRPLVSRWLLAWWSFLAAFGVKTLLRLSPEHILGVEQLFAAVKLVCRDVFGVLLGIGRRLAVLKLASCLLGAFLCTFLQPTKVMRKSICLARSE